MKKNDTAGIQQMEARMKFAANPKPRFYHCPGCSQKIKEWQDSLYWCKSCKKWFFIMDFTNIKTEPPPEEQGNEE